ncbi:uncharacterized protein LOC135502048 [Lineus longissimus]|uniref:uncharacterized protein LOC135502048 n=1 Tax=Lineus longissimus TaxID=88925 RepID=UPI002B4E63E1
MKFKTVREGEQALVFNHLGEGRLIKGPQRLFLFRQRLQKLTSYSASQHEYLVIKNKDGVVCHMPGPCQVFHNTLEYDEIRVEPSIKLDANHMIVVYKKMKESVARRVVQGPTVFIPAAEEWLHQFAWHGSDPKDKTRMVPALKRFTQLTTIPDQFYYNVKDVRTVDDTMITVKLMLFFELKDIIKMLETTHDPIADMINAVCADVIAFVGKLSFEEFLASTTKLSQLDTYPQLLQRVERVGYQMNKVVYRGYHSSEKLQAMQDSAIQSRTQMRLNAEIQDQQQKLTDFKLSKEQARTELRQSTEKNKMEHEQKVQGLRQEHSLVLKMTESEAVLLMETMDSQAQLERQRFNAELEADYLQSIKLLGVDVTKYLCSKMPPPVSEEIQVSKI